MLDLTLIALTVLMYGVSAEFEPCGGKPADVFFVLDSSGSISTRNFRKELKFTEDVASMFDTKENQVQVGAISFSKTVSPQFGLGEYDGREDMLNKIEQISYEGLGTNTAEALNYLYEKGFAKEKARPDIPHIAIILTDGMSQDMKSTLEEARKVHDSGITVFVIGIGNQVDKAELAAMGSKPIEKFVFMIDNFDVLAEIKEQLAIKACEVKPATPAPGYQNTEAEVASELISLGQCTPRAAIDIVFAVDSAAIGASNTKFVLEFIGNISSHLDMKTGDVTMAMISNGCSDGNIEEPPSSDPEQIKKGLADYHAPKFDQLMRNMRLKAGDGRQQTKHVGVVFVSDHLSPYELRKSSLEAKRARFQKVGIFVLGIGDRVDDGQLEALTTKDSEYFRVFGFENLADVGNALLYRLCLYGTTEG